MSRAFTPPDSLSKEDIRKIADVRRSIWKNAFVGLGTGTLIGIVGHSAAQLGNRRGWWKLPLSRNTAFLTVMLGGAFGSFLASVTTGKNEVHNLHPIYEIGATPGEKRDTPYQQSLKRAREREDELRTIERHRTGRGLADVIHDKEAAERVERERNRLFRRATLERNLQEGHGGLSDSHGGHWVSDEANGRK